MTGCNTILIPTRPDSGKYRFTVVVDGGDLVAGEVAVPGDAFALTRVNGLHFPRTTRRACFRVASNRVDGPFESATLACDGRHSSIVVERQEPRRSGVLPSRETNQISRIV